jgi:sigma-B regulation protein RsbU (phosphoserine phosphatase)
MNSTAQTRDAVAKILIVEDTYEVQQAIAMFLRTLGYTTVCASSPQEALELIGANEFDLVLLDLNYRRDTTSGAEGLQLLSVLHARGIDAPVIAMTAWGSIDVAVEAMHKGAVDFLQKPWDNAHLKTLVERYVEQRRQVRAARKREQMEWEDAVAVQRRLMPRELPQVPGFSIAAMSRPFGSIGGDYYDVFQMSEKLALCIGDVVGKGIPAALMMSNLQAAVKVTAAHWVSPSEVCRRVNELACSNGESDRLISFFYAVLDTDSRRMTYCNCGHNPPLLARADGSIHRLETGGRVIGFRRDESFAEDTVCLDRGDRLLLYTDGLIEARDRNAEEFGEDRVANLLGAAPCATAQDVLDHVVRAATDYCGDQFQDDVTAVVICA